MIVMLRKFALLLVGVVCFGLLPGVAVALPEGRVYEMVSPLYKAGQGANLEAVAPNGESVEFQSIGSFAGTLWQEEAGNHYLARRSPTGWSTESVGAPPVFSTSDYSSTLETVVGGGGLEVSKEGALNGGKGSVYLLHRTDVADTPGSWEVAGGGFVLKLINGGLGQTGLTQTESADLCHIIIGEVESALLPEAAGTTGQLYDFAAAPAGGCRGDGSSPLRLVAVKNRLGVHGEPEVMNGCTVHLAGENHDFNAVAAGGEEIFFAASVEGGNCTGDYQLFVRLGGRRTVEVSRPLSEAEAQACGEEVPCPAARTRASADFRGASEDGSRVFFTTSARLSGEDGDAGSDLYMANVGCPGGKGGECAVAEREVVSLVQVSHDPAGGVAEVQGVVRVASDGSRVYFVAHGVLGVGANAEGQIPVNGAENLYVYDARAGSVVFVADLCSGPVSSGSVVDGRCPTTLDTGVSNDTRLWSGGGEVQSTPDGRFLVFSSFARLSRGDTDTAKDVYRYDAQTGVLDRVSLGVAGSEANGNNSLFDATIPIDGIPGGSVFQEYELGTRAISGDGSRIVFRTAGPLSPGAVNGLVNVYEWHKEAGVGEGVVSLVSSGSSLTSDFYATISPSGRDVFFGTTAGLVQQDTEEDPDIYDARLGGGFAPVPVSRQPCSGDACQGPLTNPAPLLVPGSVPQAPGGNLAAPVKAKVKKKTRKKRVPGKKGVKGKRSAGRAVRVARRQVGTGIGRGL